MHTCSLATLTNPADGPAKEALLARQPGNDGGKFVRRFEKRTIPNLDAPNIDDHTIRSVLADLLEIFVIKVAGRLSESDVDNTLAHMVASYRRQHLHKIADAYPTTCKAMLTMLEEWSVVSWDTEVHYKQCPCGLVYRNTCNGDYRAHTACPVCNCAR